MGYCATFKIILNENRESIDMYVFLVKMKAYFKTMGHDKIQFLLQETRKRKKQQDL